MPANRVVVLGVDALERDLVLEHDLESLLQAQHGTVTLPEMDQIHTQVIWPTFFTGLRPEEHGITLENRYEWKHPVVRALKQSVSWALPGSVRSRIGAYLRSSGFEMKYRDESYFETEGIKTLFSHVRSTAISVPGYNEDDINEELRVGMHAVLEGTDDRERLLDRCEEVFVDRRERVLEAVRGDDRLVMGHLYTTDAVGHVCYNDPDRLVEYYGLVSELVEDIRTEIGPEDLLLVVSDHGMRDGKHTDHGFYSVNREVGWDTEIHVTDFYDLLLDELGIDPTEAQSRKEVQEHLEDLGYV
jgi:predicted AlkP superfamily pyrophosphatase or phosphodiesterase